MSNIPMSRPADFGDRFYLDDEEYSQRVQQVEATVERSENDAESTFRFDFGRRAFRQTSQVVDPPKGRQPATLPGLKQMPRGTFGNGPLDWTTDFSLYERCITRGIFGSVLRVMYGNGNRIVQSPGTGAFSYEMLPTRLFYTDNRRARARTSTCTWAPRARAGKVRARRGNDEPDRPDGLRRQRQRTVPQHAMKVTKKFKRVADDILQYQVTVDDPLTYEAPFTVSMPLTPLDGGKLLPYDCHPGNYAILQSLGERVEDRRIEEDLGRGVIRPRSQISDGAGP